MLAACGESGDGTRPAQAAAESVCDRAALRAELDTIAMETGGRLSVSFVDPASGERFSFNGTAPVFMSSVVKLPVAVQLLARVDAGELSLADTLRVDREQLSIGHSPLAAQYPDGVALPVDSLLRRAVSDSDNSAHDALLRYSGGPRRVTAELQRLGIADIRVDRNYLEYGWDLFGGGARPTRTALTRTAVERARSAALSAADAVHDSLSAAFASQPEDRATTDAVAALLARLARGELLSDSSRTLLRRLLTETRNPRDRIVAALPRGVVAAHKTGTWTDWNDVFTSISDVGLIRLSDDTEIALAVMIAEAPGEEASLAASIAEATGAVLRDWTRCRGR